MKKDKWLSGKRAGKVHVLSGVLPWVSYLWVFALFSIKYVMCLLLWTLNGC